MRTKFQIFAQQQKKKNMQKDCRYQRYFTQDWLFSHQIIHQLLAKYQDKVVYA